MTQIELVNELQWALGSAAASSKEWLRQLKHGRGGIGQERLDIGRPRPKQGHYVPGRPIADPQPEDLRWRAQYSGQPGEVLILRNDRQPVGGCVFPRQQRSSSRPAFQAGPPRPAWKAGLPPFLPGE